MFEQKLIGDSQTLKRNHPLGLSDSYRNVLLLSALAARADSFDLPRHRNPHARTLSVFSSARTRGSPRGYGRIVDCHSRRDFAQNRVQCPDVRCNRRRRLHRRRRRRRRRPSRFRSAIALRNPRVANLVNRGTALVNRALCAAATTSSRYLYRNARRSLRRREAEDHLGRETRLVSVYLLCAAIRCRIPSHRSCLNCIRFPELGHPDQV